MRARWFEFRRAPSWRDVHVALPDILQAEVHHIDGPRLMERLICLVELRLSPLDLELCLAPFVQSL